MSSRSKLDKLKCHLGKSVALTEAITHDCECFLSLVSLKHRDDKSILYCLGNTLVFTVLQLHSITILQ